MVSNLLGGKAFLSQEKQNIIVLAMEGSGGGDWRSQLQPEARGRITAKILESLNKKLGADFAKGLVDLQRVSARIEGRFFSISCTQSDYLRRLSLRMLKLETEPIQLGHQQAVDQSSESKVGQYPTSMLQQQTSCDQQSLRIQVDTKLQEMPPNEHLLDQVPPRSQKKLCVDDRLSDLPDTILHHIMSLLSAQEVARTCILSKRWKELSASAPCLDICVDKFGMDRVRFSEFVAHLLLSRAPNSLHTFRLHSFAIDHASSWINRAIELKAQVLEFTEYIRWESFYLDPQLMAFASQYLKCLKLTNVTLDSNAFEPLNHACPALENLQLSQCFLEVPEICSASLKKLDIMECSLLMNLQIQTPRLVSLRFRCLQYKCSSCSRYPVITAAVTLCDLPNAENIDLSCSGRQVTFGREIQKFPMYGKLTSISLGEWCLSDKFSRLFCLLRHSPELKELTLKLEVNNIIDVERQDHNGEDEIRLMVGRSFSAENLKKVTICCAEGDARAAMLGNMFRANATSLKEMHIKHY